METKSRKTLGQLERKIKIEIEVLERAEQRLETEIQDNKDILLEYRKGILFGFQESIKTLKNLIK